MAERRGIATAGTWCVDFNKTIAEWPAEDTTNEVLAMDRQGGGSACNMAIDLKRLDPALPVETMGVVGDDDDARFLLAQCDAFGVEHEGLASLPGGATMSVDAFNVLSTGRRTHFYHQGVAALMSPEHFDFSRSRARFPASRPARRTCADGRALARRSQRLGRDSARGAPMRPRHQSRADVDCARQGRRAGAPVPAASRHAHRQRFRDRRGRRHGDARCERRRSAKRSRAPSRRRCRSARWASSSRISRKARSRRRARAGALRSGSVAMPEEEIAGVNGAGDAFAAGMLYALHEGWPNRRRPAARPRLRGRVDARGFDDCGGRAGRRVPGAGGKMGFAAGAGLTRGAPRGRRGAHRFVKRKPCRRGTLSLSHRLRAPRRNLLQRGEPPAGPARHSAQRQGARAGERGRAVAARRDGGRTGAARRRRRLLRFAARCARARRWSWRAPRWVCAPERYHLCATLKELTFGDWEGLTWPEVEARDAAAARAREADKWNFAPPRGESYAMLVERLRPWLAARQGDCFVASHGGVARAFMFLLAGVIERRSRERQHLAGAGADVRGGRV